MMRREKELEESDKLFLNDIKRDRGKLGYLPAALSIGVKNEKTRLEASADIIT